MLKKNLNNYNGYIEGFYGRLLNWDERKLIIQKLKSNKMNSYLYAPKEDLYHRILWRESYNKDWIFNFREFCAFSKTNKVKVLVGISPGLDFKFQDQNSYEKDLKILKKKFLQLIKCGADKIVLLLDDIPNDFEERFSKLKEGFEHAKLCNQIYKNFRHNLIVVPRVYSDELVKDSRNYLKEFTENLLPDIPIFYTGEHIISHKHNSKDKFIKKN